ncbi:hypothetical protein [Methylomagnum ishizawai]|uniref:hypothetical protein n=1 Tax=Methylomagnum ishizawai TaxID=1760988 RepID=UPI001C336904|nr:hypothetical protein [Methylomagnum ishizawai]BBL76416.1 hypothetical protein MishRS11D_35140 [Methylomagnum ishizawai]
MAFVNEYIPKEDLEKYNFAELNKRPMKGGGTRRDWTIDRKANIWLRKFYTESEHTKPGLGLTGVSAWDFYWKGHLMMAEVKDLGIEGERGQPCWQRKKLLSINIPPELEVQRPQIIKDLEAAFTEHRGAGVFSSQDYYSRYTFTLKL